AISVPPSQTTLKLMGGKTYHPKPEAVVTGSQNRKPRVGIEPPADRSARCGKRASGTKRKNLMSGDSWLGSSFIGDGSRPPLPRQGGLDEPRPIPHAGRDYSIVEVVAGMMKPPRVPLSADDEGPRPGFDHELKRP